jgi:hypothetical protein
MRVRSAVVLAVVTSVLSGCGGGGGSSSRNSATAPISTATTTPTTSTTTPTPTVPTTPGGGSTTTTGGNTSSGSAATGATSGGYSGGTGNFVDASALLPNSSAQDYGADAADLDGDNDIDIAIAVNGGGPSRILWNEPTGFVERAGSFPSTVMAATDVRVVNVDGDQDLDLIFCANYEPVRVFLNNGLGVFTAGGEFNIGNDCLTYNIALGDVEGDGDQDVFLANAGQSTVSRGQNKLFLNNGQGVFTQAAANAIPVKNDDSLDATFFDVDRDGDLDIFVANFGVAHSLLVNDGTGLFLNQADVWLPPALTRYGTSVAHGDLDRDGKVDLYVCNEGVGTGGGLPPGEKNTLLLQNLTLAKFDDASTRVPSEAEASFAVRLIDVNGDGWQDVIVSNLRAVQRLFLNQQGILVDSTSTLPAVNSLLNNATGSHGLTIGDFNADLAPDVFFVRRGQKPWLFLNTR